MTNNKQPRDINAIHATIARQRQVLASGLKPIVRVDQLDGTNYALTITSIASVDGMLSGIDSDGHYRSVEPRNMHSLTVLNVVSVIEY